MEQKKEMSKILDLIDRPALCVRDGTIYLLNRAASQRGFETDRPIAPLLGPAAEEYEGFRDGSLFLPLEHSGMTYAASVFSVEDYHVFVIEQEMDQEVLDALALAAMKLRDPLSDINTMLDRLSPIIQAGQDLSALHYLEVLQHRLFQMQRTIFNMSDAARYASSKEPKLESVDICSVLEDLLDRIEALTSMSGIKLCWELPMAVTPAMVDVERLERAVYNMISNAMKVTPQGGTIHVKLARRKDRILLSVRDHGTGISDQLMGTVFTRFRRRPGLESAQEGLGLGLSLICSGATAHGGTVLIDRPSDGGTRVTMSFPVKPSTGTMVRSNTISFDYAGEQDHGLLELSDSLPSKLYRQIH